MRTLPQGLTPQPCLESRDMAHWKSRNQTTWPPRPWPLSEDSMTVDLSRRSFLRYGVGAVAGSMVSNPAEPRPKVGAQHAAPLHTGQAFELEETTVAQLQDSMRTGARTAADRLDAERKAGHVRGPLHGIPVLVKDNIATVDRMMTTAGSLALVGVPAPRDAALVARLRAAGAVIIGKTNLSEWANIRSSHSISGWSGRGGQCRN